MPRRLDICALSLLLASLAGCSKKEEPPPVAAAAPAPVAAPAPAPTAAPDFGGTTKVSREAEGIGSTPELAVLAALQSAIAQVNGVRVAGQMQSVRAGLDVSGGRGSESVRSQTFVQQLIAASQGAVTGFEILSRQEIDKIDEQTTARVRASDAGYRYSASASASAQASASGRSDASVRVGGDSAQGSGSYDRSLSYDEKASVDVQRGATSHASDYSHQKMRSYWTVRVRADIAQYRAPDDQGRPKIVVAMPRTLTPTYAVGDGRVDATEVASAVRGRLTDMLSQTKRFMVLDREFGREMQAEIDHIGSGNVRVQDSARLGQQLGADLILIPSIERFEYLRSARQLRMSDRELVSYSGGGRITLRLLNAATGEVVMSDSFEHRLAAADPSTMPRVIDGKNMAAEMMQSLSGQIGSAIVTEIFPISAVSLTGDQLVLSQGGDTLKVGQRWQAVYLGEELKDPQTGRSLGRAEMPVGTIRIDRVSSQTSYGTLEEPTLLADKPFRPGAVVLRQPAGVRAVAAAAPSSTAGTPAERPAAASPPRTTRAQPAQAASTPAPARPAAADDKW